MGVDVDTDIDVDVDVVGSAWGSRPGGQWCHSHADSCGPTTMRGFFLLHLLPPPSPPPAPVAYLAMDVGRGREYRCTWRRARGLLVTLELGWGGRLGAALTEY